MKEREYIDATNLAKIRAARMILRDTLDMTADGAERQIGSRLLRQHVLQADEDQSGRYRRLDHAGKGAVVLNAELQPPVHQNVVFGPWLGLRGISGSSRTQGLRA